jgi:hypothetical protein
MKTRQATVHLRDTIPHRITYTAILIVTLYVVMASATAS